MTPRRLRRRGQNLVLLALSMLFIVLPATMTLGLGLRIRQKRELQQLADAAAYSNAVMTARTFNNMALSNRLQVSYWVALAADESLISWTSYAKAMAAATQEAAQSVARSSCAAGLSRAQRDGVRDFADEVGDWLDEEYASGARARLFRDLDLGAGREALAIQGRVGALRSELSTGIVTESGASLLEELLRQLRTQQLTNQLIAMSRQRDVSLLGTASGGMPNQAARVSMREVYCGADTADPALDGDPAPRSGLCMRGRWSANMLEAAMGSRGHAFLTGRAQVPPRVASRLGAIAGRHSGVSVSFSKSGSAYWATRLAHGTAPDGLAAWADDHGTVTVRAGECSATRGASASVMSTHLLDTADTHTWAPVGPGPSPEAAAELVHTMGDCSPRCPSVWVRTIGFSPSPDVNDGYGQPKVMVALQRDLSARAFPWELHFRLPFSATGQAAEWDARGHRLPSAGGQGLAVHLQTAFATGIAYYHRREHWDEFPNLLNPFWRATLAPADVDAQGPADVRAVLRGPGISWQGEAYEALRARGYEGLH